MVYKEKDLGYTLVELLLSMVVGVVILAGVYSTYTIVARQQQKISSSAEIHESGNSSIRIISRDLRMTGYVSLDTDLETPFGNIATPITITDSGNACCDSVQIIYDLDTPMRQRITYYVLPRTNPARNAIYMDKDTWDGFAWTNVTNQSLVADYIEDLQFVGSDNNLAGFPSVVDVSMIFRAKNPVATPAVAYAKPTYNVGNYNFTANDSYLRDEFTTTVTLKNLRDASF